jgi:RNA polymerase sigma-70 factor (ECF subfamily)
MVDHLSDAILLERFVMRREEAAFAALVRRHGPVVVGTCRRVLRSEHDIEDVFQTTFLVLARKAALIGWRESVAGWLCAVAHRLALGARADVSRQRRRETSITRLTHSDWDVVPPAAGDGVQERWHAPDDPLAEAQRRDLREVLDDELLHLPEKYRAPVVLCYLEGRTHAEAARELGWPAGSMSRRLDRARRILKQRLVGRGVSLALGLVAASLALYGAWNAGRRAPHSSPSAVRQAMRSLVPLSERGRVGKDIAAGLPGDRSSSGSDRLMALARQASAAAETIRQYDPGTNRNEWRRFTELMRVSAEELTHAATENDSVALLLAARRLDSSCVNCHNLFQTGPPHADRLE